MRTTSFQLAALAAALVCTQALAQYTGPGASASVRTVAEASAGKDDTPVELEGYLIRQLSKDKYLFSDGKQQIRVDIDQEDFPQGAINERTKVRIKGVVEKDLLESPEIDVSHLEIVQ